MAIQFSITVRNARADAIETAIGATAMMRIRTGAMPANCAAADTGTVLATLTLPSDWMAAASAGTKAKAGTWEDASADATGVAAHFRIYDAAGTTCHWQDTGGGGDMEVSNVNFASGQPFTVTSFTLTEANA